MHELWFFFFLNRNKICSNGSHGKQRYAAPTCPNHHITPGGCVASSSKALFPRSSVFKSLGGSRYLRYIYSFSILDGFAWCFLTAMRLKPKQNFERWKYNDIWISFVFVLGHIADVQEKETKPLILHYDRTHCHCCIKCRYHVVHITF